MVFNQFSTEDLSQSHGDFPNVQWGFEITLELKLLVFPQIESLRKILMPVMLTILCYYAFTVGQAGKKSFKANNNKKAGLFPLRQH